MTDPRAVRALLELEDAGLLGPSAEEVEAAARSELGMPPRQSRPTSCPTPPRRTHGQQLEARALDLEVRLEAARAAYAASAAEASAARKQAASARRQVADLQRRLRTVEAKAAADQIALEEQLAFAKRRVSEADSAAWRKACQRLLDMRSRYRLDPDLVLDLRAGLAE